MTLDRLRSNDAIPASLNLRQQWEANVRTLSESGILEIDTETHMLGIRGIDGNHYPIPTVKDIEKRLQEAPYLKEKIAQGFTKVLLVPFAYPLDSLAEKLAGATLRQHERGGLISTDGTKLPLDTNQPLWLWDKYKNADKEGRILYRPARLDTHNHGGKTKRELLTNPHEAWSIILLEDTLDVPREGQGATTAGRKQIESNKTPHQYLKLTATPSHTHETGLTLEDELTHALMRLTQENRIINDYQGTGSLVFCTGAWVPSSGYVPCLCWHRNARQWRVGRYDPSLQREYYGFRPGVRV